MYRFCAEMDAIVYPDDEAPQPEEQIEFLDSETDPDFTAEQFERMDGLEGLGYKKHPNPNTLCTLCGEPWISCPCDNELEDDGDEPA
jgi:hypothetical protein